MSESGEKTCQPGSCISKDAVFYVGLIACAFGFLMGLAAGTWKYRLPAGEPGGPCYPNQSCNAKLVCAKTGAANEPKRICIADPDL